MNNTARKEPFGDVLRRLRKKAGRSLGDVARLLEVSVAFLSQVEHGKRLPLSEVQIENVANFLQVEPGELLVSAAQTRGNVHFRPRGSRRSFEVSVYLARRLPELTDQQLTEVETLLRRQEKEGGEEV